LALSACATLPPPSGFEPAVDTADAAFGASGRLSAKHGSEGAAAHFRWEHVPGRDTISLATPMGSTLARLERDSGGASIAFPDGRIERLPQGEFKLLMALLRHAGQVLSRDQLMDAIHDREWTPNDRTVDVLVGRVRRKLDDNPADPRLILTAHGAGYLFAGELD